VAKFTVETEFVFKGRFEVEADTPDEAERKVKEDCGLVMGGEIHTTLPDDEVDWDFPHHPETRVTDAVRMRRGGKK
jgi:hypothetical protein